MKSRSCLLIITLLALSLTSCGQQKSSQEIAETVQKSIVLISYQNEGGGGTGFIVPGPTGVCTVLTARHVVEYRSLNLQTNDEKSWKTDSIQTSPNFDLAVVKFKSVGETCPYLSLNLGNSDSVKIYDKIYISGWLGGAEGGKLEQQSVIGSVSKLDVRSEGYGISYDASTFPGMSGSPVLDINGKVVAVHGVSINGFRWGIPIKTYLENQSNFVNQPIAKADSTKLENKSDVITVIPNIKVDSTKPPNKSDVIPIPKVDYTKPEIKSGIVIPKVDYTKPENKSYLVNQPIAKADYTKLEQLLAAGKWQEADRETANKMLEVAGQQKIGWLAGGDIYNFSCPDLRAMDRLWVKYSDGRFGFSVQKQIYQSLGGTKEYDMEVWKAYETAIGWRKNDRKKENNGDYSQRTFNSNGSSGHLPDHHGWGGEGVAPGLVVFFFSHAETCAL